MRIILCTVILVLFSKFLFSQTTISVDSVSSYIGQHIKICDKVSDAFQPKGDIKMTYINFGGKFPDNTFTVVIFPADLPNFSFIPADHYKNQKVCVTGIAAEFKGKPQIVAKFPDQIEIQ